jgi:hypothetical protein
LFLNINIVYGSRDRFLTYDKVARRRSPPAANRC